MTASWSCPHDLNGVCQRVAGAQCRPGMRGCVLHGRFVLANAPGPGELKPLRAPEAAPDPPPPRRRLPF